MKLRVGFVSNSSSASFVVVVRDYSFEKKYCERKILKEKEDLLINFGFQYMKGYPHHLLTSPGEIVDSIDEFGEKEEINLYFDVLCNEDEVTDFLFEHKIPFMASIQNDVYLMVYDGKSDYYEIFTDYAKYYLIYGNTGKSAFELFKYVKPYYKEKINGDAKEELFLGNKILRFQEELETIGKEAKEFFSKKELEKINDFIYKRAKERIERTKI